MSDDQQLTADGGYEPAYGFGPHSNRTSRLGDVWAIGSTEYRLAVTNRWAIALVAIFAAFSLGLLTFSGANVGPDGSARVLGSLTVLAVYLIPLAALAYGFDAIVGHEDIGWLQALFALPIARWRVVVGIFLGRSLALTAAVVLGFGAGGFLIVRDFGLAGWYGFLAFVVGAVGLALVFLAIAILVSTVAREKTHALGASLLVWAWFVLVHDLLALGLISAFHLPDFALEAMILTNPAGVFRVLVLGWLDAGGGAGFAAVIASTGLSTPVLLGALVCWIVLPIAIAGKLIGRRRL